MLKNRVCSSTLTLIDVMHVLNKSGLGIVFCVDKNNRFCGTLSDGDIRRSILAGVPLETVVEKILDRQSEAFKKILSSCENPSMLDSLKKESVFAYEGTSTENLMKMVNERISIIPILNKERNIVDYFEYKAHFNIPIATSILSGEEISNVLECLETNWISSQGKFVQKFEELIAEYIGVKYAVSCMNGTAALTMALLALHIGPGDEVILPDLTFGATVNAVLFAGAKPVIVDINEDDWCISMVAIKNAITKSTKAIMPVHLYGYPCNMREIRKISKENNLFCVEDVAEAFGAEFDDTKLGGFGDISCFSFFGNKIITTGEGGACVTNDKDLYEKLLIIRDHGMSKNKKYWHEMVGFNFRMTNLQAAVGCGQIKRVREILKVRENIKNIYLKNLKGCPYLRPQKECNQGVSVVWLVSYLLDAEINREELIFRLKKHNIDIRPFFYSLSSMPLYSKFGLDCKTSKKISPIGINLPTIVNLGEDDYKFICENILKTIEEMRADNKNNV